MPTPTNPFYPGSENVFPEGNVDYLGGPAPVATGSPDATEYPFGIDAETGQPIPPDDPRMAEIMSSLEARGITDPSKTNQWGPPYFPSSNGRLMLKASSGWKNAFQKSGDVGQQARSGAPHPASSGASGGASTGGTGSVGGAPVGSGARPAGGGGSSSSSSSGSAGAPARGSVSNPYPPDVTQGADPGFTVGGGGGGENGPPFDPNAPLGIDFGNRGPGGVQGGNPAFQSGTFPRASDWRSGLDANSTYMDLAGSFMDRQQENQQAALGIFGGTYDQFQNDPLRGAIAGNAQALQANPFSLDDATIQRMMGQQGELIGQNANRLSQLSANRAASSGVGRSGMQQADQDRIAINAMRDLGNTQRGLLVEQATRRPQELQQAMAAGTNVLSQQQGVRERAAAGAAGVLGQTDYTTDAMLLGGLSGQGVPPINVNNGGRSGPIGSMYYSGPTQYNPFAGQR